MGSEREAKPPNGEGENSAESATLEELARLRHSELRLDREGRWWHQGQPVEHPRLNGALHRWLDRLDDGRYVLRLDAERFAYVEVEDAPYQVRRVELERTAEGTRVHLLLSDGSEEELDYASLRVGTTEALYCLVKGDRPARFSRPAYYLLGELLEEDPGGFVLRAAGERWPIQEGMDGTPERNLE